MTVEYEVLSSDVFLQQDLNEPHLSLPEMIWYIVIHI